MSTLKGKVAVITGGNSGIGYSTAKSLRDKGAQVIITGRRKEAVESAAHELGVTGLIADQSNIADIELLASEVARRIGKIDILLVNAGITQFNTIEQMQESMFDAIMDVNLKGAYFTVSRFIPVLNDGASVILLGSSSGTVHGPMTSVYSASKAAVNSLVKSAALELAPRKITVNAVSPGPVATEIMNKIGVDAAMEQHIINGVPLSRLGKPGEVASLITYLAGEDARWITGAEFLVDGGHAINT